MIALFLRPHVTIQALGGRGCRLHCNTLLWVPQTFGAAISGLVDCLLRFHCVTSLACRACAVLVRIRACETVRRLLNA